MKKITYLILSVVLPLSGCNDGFMEREPVTTQAESNIFKTYSGFQTYAWSLYRAFNIPGGITGAGSVDYYYANDIWGNYMSRGQGTAWTNQYAWQNATVPATNSDGNWNFDFIRSCNVMLGNVDKSDMSDNDKAHWRSVGYFFRSWRYYTLLNQFGDVPWIPHTLSEADSVAANVRVPRAEVAANVLQDLQYAEKNINLSSPNVSANPANTINQDCVRALMSRFCLQEGTTRKYRGNDYSSDAAHPTDDDLTKSYLAECIRVSKLLMDKYPTLGAHFDELVTANKGNGLKGYPGVILYKQYELNQIVHGMCRVERANGNVAQANKHIVKMFVCKDGLPISKSPMYTTDADMYSEFSGRDRRLWLSVMPPYRVYTAETAGATAAVITPPVGAKLAWWYNETDPRYRAYIDSLEMITQPYMKRLPIANFAGQVNYAAPYFTAGGDNPQSPGPLNMPQSTTGYYIWKNYNLWEDCSTNAGMAQTSDKVIFHVEEAMLNYAEAYYEYYGELPQSVADLTINKLRSRVGTDPLTVGDIDETWAPEDPPGAIGAPDQYPMGRPNGVPAVLWEIRRERIMELLGEGFAWNDIRRWGIAPWFMNRQTIGACMKSTDPNMKNVKFWNPVTKSNDGVSGNPVWVSADPVAAGKGWIDAYYLAPIPYGEINSSNGRLSQNPGWR